MKLNLLIALTCFAFGSNNIKAQEKTIFVSEVKSLTPFDLIITENDSRDTVLRIDTAKEFQFTVDNSTKFTFYNSTDTIFIKDCFRLLNDENLNQWELHVGKNKKCLQISFWEGSMGLDSISCHIALKESECINCSGISFTNSYNQVSKKAELWRNIEKPKKKKPVKK